MGGDELEDQRDDSELLRLAAGGDQEALRVLFSRHRDRLKRMVHLRLSRRLAGRVDDSDVLQEAFLEAARAPRGVRQRAVAAVLPLAPAPDRR